MDDPLIGTQLGHFKIEKLIAEGGMGLIYLAAHTVIGRKAAIKVLSEKFSSDANMVKRLHREAQAVNRIGHPNIIDVFDFGQTPDSRQYFVMEYLPGRSLAQLEHKYGRIPWSLAAPILSQTLDGLAAAHDLGIVHRDVKPENILVVRLEQGGVQVKILDFGIAKSVGLGAEGERLTRAGSVMGTPEYIAPEQIRGREVDGRADLYAVGAILFEMVMGRRPFESDKVISLLMAHLRDPVPSMDGIPPELEVPQFVPAVVNKAMAKEPEDRFPDARTFARALQLETSAVAPSDGTRPLPMMLWEKGEAPGPEPEREPEPEPRTTTPPPRTGDGFPAGATRPSLAARAGSFPEMLRPTVPGGRPIPSAEIAPHGPSPLRWVVPLVVVLLSGAAILFYLALRPARIPAVVAPDAKASAPRPGPKAPPKEIDLGALVDSVRHALRTGMRSAVPEVRRLSIQGVGAMRDSDAVPLLIATLKDDPDSSVRSSAAMALAAIADPSGVAALRDVRPQSSEAMRVWIDEALMRLGRPEGVVELTGALKSPSPEVQLQAALALGEAGNRAAIPILEGVVRQAAVLKRQSIIAVLGTLARLGHEASYQSLLAALSAADGIMRLGAAEALARLGDDRATPTLRQVLQTGDAATRLMAAKILASIGDYAGIDRLVQGSQSKEAATRRLAAEGLGRVSDKATLAPLSLLLDDPDGLVKAAAADALARILSQMPTALVRRSQDWLRTALDNRDWAVREAAVGVSSELDPELAINLLGWAFKDKDPRVREAAVASIESLRSPKTVPLLTVALGDTSDRVRARAARALGSIRAPEARDALLAATRDSSHAVRAAAAGSYLALGDTAYLNDLRGAVRSPTVDLRRSAIDALGRWNDRQAEPLLLAALEDKSSQVRFAAANQLARRGSQAGIGELKRALGKGGEEERQALQAMFALGVKPTAELTALGSASAAEKRRSAMAAASLLDGAEALTLLRQGARDPSPEVRLAVAGSLARMVDKTPSALPLLRALARDGDPLVRTRSELALAKMAKARSAPDMGKVAPVQPTQFETPPLVVAPKPDAKQANEPRPLFVDDKSPQQQYLRYSALATLAIANGKYEAALKLLKQAQQHQDAPELLIGFGLAHLKIAIRDLQRSPATARDQLLSARGSFKQYLARAPKGKQVGKARGGLDDVRRLLKSIE